MKSFAFAALFLTATASAFTVRTPNSMSSSSTALFSSVRPDASAAIQAAMQATKKFGATSPEARVAWDAVEEIDASDNSAAFQPSLDEGCLVEEEISQACLEYGEKMGELQKYIAQHQLVDRVKEIQSMAEEIKAVKIKSRQGTPGHDNPQVRAALAEARAASDKYGPTSPEARVAWDNLEEVASAGLDNAMGPRLDEECLVDSAMEACQALEELNRVIDEHNQ